MGPDELQQLHQRFEWHYPEDNIQGVVGWALDEFRDMQVSATGSFMINSSILKVAKGLCFSPSIVPCAVADCQCWSNQWLSHQGMQIETCLACAPAVDSYLRLPFPVCSCCSLSW